MFKKFTKGDREMAQKAECNPWHHMFPESLRNNSYTALGIASKTTKYGQKMNSYPKSYIFVSKLYII